MTITKQQAFDTIARHMLSQGTRSVDHCGDPVIMGLNGTKDPIGCLIPEEDYRPDLEGMTAAEVFTNVGVLRSDEVISIAEQLRQVHDLHSPADWGYWLKHVAESEDLSWDG